jgi:hypothetical protein
VIDGTCSAHNTNVKNVQKFGEMRRYHMGDPDIYGRAILGERSSS